MRDLPAQEGLAPPARSDVQALLLGGLSAARRLTAETYEYEREAWHNAVGLVAPGAFLLAAVLFLVLLLCVRELPAALGIPLTLGLLADVTVGLVFLAAFLLGRQYRPRLRELRRWETTFLRAFEREPHGIPPPERAPSTVELLAEAAARAPLRADGAFRRPP